jgi:hypothetical protein
MVKTQKRPKPRSTAKRARPAKRSGAKPVTKNEALSPGSAHVGIDLPEVLQVVGFVDVDRIVENQEIGAVPRN